MREARKLNLAFQISSFRSFSAFKISYFCQKRCLTSFSPSGKLTKWAQFVFARKIFRKLSLRSHTFLQKRCSFKSFSILEENCAADITDERFKCKSFVGKCCKKRPLSKSYLPTNALFFVFQFFSILEKNCAVDITCCHFCWQML